MFLSEKKSQLEIGESMESNLLDNFFCHGFPLYTLFHNAYYDEYTNREHQFDCYDDLILPPFRVVFLILKFVICSDWLL